MSHLIAIYLIGKLGRITDTSVLNYRCICQSNGVNDIYKPLSHSISTHSFQPTHLYFLPLCNNPQLFVIGFPPLGFHYFEKMVVSMLCLPYLLMIDATIRSTMFTALRRTYYVWSNIYVRLNIKYM